MSLIEKAVERLEGLLHEGERSGGASQPLPSYSMPSSQGSTVAERPETHPSSTSKVASQYVDIDFAKLRSGGFIVPDAPQSLTSEEFRILKRPLLANVTNAAAPIRNASLIMVTSSLPGEGKSFTALNLALSVATELDKTVLLVDADVARPSLPRLLGLPEQKGLLDVLQDKSLKLSDVLLRSNIDKLTILTAGTRGTHATELLASDAMGKLLNELARRYSDRIIIFDSPPLLPTTEARVLATRMGQIVFVVRAEETPRNAIKEALAAIEACPVKLMVLNQSHNVEHAAYGYEYGYGY
jgi:protein-tyrosine kinase